MWKRSPNNLRIPDEHTRYTPPPPSSGAQPANSAPAAPPNTSPTETPRTPPTATVEIAPPPLAFGAPAEGRVIEGVLAARTAVDQFLLETNSGAITIRTAAPFRIGAPLKLQIVSNGATILAAVITPEPGNSPPDGALKADAPTVSTKLLAGPSQGANPTFIATVTGGPSNAPLATPSIATSSNAAPRRTAAGAPPSGGLATGGIGANGKITGANITEIRAPLPVGSRAPLRLLAARPVGQPPPAGPLNASGGPESPFNATVTAASAAGELVTVKTPLGELTFPTERPLPVGANLLLQISGLVETPAFEPASPQALAFAPQWDTLQALLSAFPPGATASASVENAIPKPNAQLTASAMFFMSALRMGDLRQWLGSDAMSVLEQSGLLGKMADEFSAMGTLASETMGNDWRLFLIPLISESLLQNLKLYIHDNAGESEGDDESNTQRFVIEVEFSRLGPFQFEGLSRPKQFDLIVRTERNIGDDLQSGIADVFNNTITSLGLTGGIDFKIEEPFLWQPMQSASPTGPDILI
jgi:hypothetical protein